MNSQRIVRDQKSKLQELHELIKEISYAQMLDTYKTIHLNYIQF